MIRSLFTSATGMAAQQLVVDNTANNLANVNTTGFKRSLVSFQDLIYLTQRPIGAETAAGQQEQNGLQIGSGVRIAGTTKVFNEGVLENTNNPLDLAIEGDGFFRVQLPNGTFRYTRDGSFRINANGQIVTSDGFLLDPPITVPNNTLSISIATDGTVSVITADAPNTTNVVGNLILVRFPNPAGLSSEGRNLFSDTAASGAPIEGTPGQDGLGTIRQGFLERSNVDVVQELINLILAQRAYEFNTKAIRVADDMLATSNELVR
ncbi:MAG: flagellar basal-body rod protein FlgG [Gemmatales bacterium]|nr:flagellar basal-body rod protein FlgG [Gemmatales bacterium]MDW7994326.1 flagellar basal-body rod protein FlgG [Gemmatales bacterium]